MDASGTSALLYRTSKPLGKVRRRVQDLRIPSSSYYDFLASRPVLDLSHSESARLAGDSLLSRGLEGYHEVLKAEGEVDFLSQLDKIYILENGRDGSTADPAASDDDDDDDDEELGSISVGSQSITQYPALSTDSDPTVTGLDLSSLKDVKWTDSILDEPSVEVYFQSDCRAAGMKDLVREFIRKARMVLAIVVNSFSDVELLCDLLEACRKRNVSVHLLLDHLDLNLFVSMWQDLKLNSINFPKLAVRSVEGQTYCAKTGRKLTGQIAESFIISDWTEVLTGSYSFSWLSWQVHRSLIVHVKGSAVVPFHQEFHRLHSSSKPVPGFVTYITVPRTVPLCTGSHAAQNHNTDANKMKPSLTKTTCHGTWNEDPQNTQTKAKMTVLPKPQSAELECSKGYTPHRADTGAHTRGKPPPKPVVQPGAQSGAVGKQTVGAAQHDTHTDVEPQGKNQNQIQIQSSPHVLYVQSQLTGLTISTTAEKSARLQESNPQQAASPAHRQHRTVRYQTTLKPHADLERRNVGTEGLFFQQRNRDRLTKPPGVEAGLNTQRHQWIRSLNFKLKVDSLSDNPKAPPPSMTQQNQTKTGIWFPMTPPRGRTSGLQANISSLGTRRQDQPHQPPLHSRPDTQAPGSKSTVTVTVAHLKTQLQSDSKLFSPGTGTKPQPQPHTSQHVIPHPRLNWMPQSHGARPRPVARHSSFDTTYRMVQSPGGQAGWRPFPSSMNIQLGRSKSLNDRHSAGYKGAGLNLNMPRT